MVFGDSRLIIQALNKGSKDKNECMVRMIKRICVKAKMFRKFQFFHIFRELNMLADRAANKSIVVGLNELIVNLVVRFEIPP